MADGRCTALAVLQAGKVLKTRVSLTNTHALSTAQRQTPLRGLTLDWFPEDTLQNMIFPAAKFLFLSERANADALIRQNRGWVCSH